MLGRVKRAIVSGISRISGCALCWLWDKIGSLMSSQNSPAVDREGVGESFPCRICGHETSELGVKVGRFRKEAFRIRRCTMCQFACVANPWTNYAEVYSEA